MNPAFGLEQQLQAAREEAELTLEQLHLVQEELEVYFLKAQDLEEQLQAATQTAQLVADRERDERNAECKRLQEELNAAHGRASQAEAERDERNAECSRLKEELNAAHERASKAQAERDERNAQCNRLQEELNAAHERASKAQAERDDALQQSTDHSSLLQTAQQMLSGQARYLEDLSLKEERAEQAVDELDILKREMLYYIQYSKPARNLDPLRVQRLIELAKKTVPPSAATRRTR